jgi:hypothetical protein
MGIKSIPPLLVSRETLGITGLTVSLLGGATGTVLNDVILVDGIGVIFLYETWCQ